MDELVSIITPCYNSGSYVHRLLDSIVMQTYNHIEMVCVDDGSIDNTADIIKHYVDIFAHRGYSLRYVYQKNQGQSAAVNNGLKLVCGKYLVWPDSDDYYNNPTTIERMVDTFNHSDNNVGMVRCFCNIVDEESLEVVDKRFTNEAGKTKLFEDCLFGMPGFWWAAGACMARMSAIDITISHRNIYTEKDAGQNAQLMLPIFYSYDCVTISEFLYSIVERRASHSRGQYSGAIRKQLKLQNVYQRTFLYTLDAIELMPVAEKRELQKQIVKRTRKIKIKAVVNGIAKYILGEKALRRMKNIG